MGCGYTVQIDDSFYDVSGLKINEQRGVGRSSASFSLEIKDMQIPPPIPALCCIISDDGTKEFGGLIYDRDITYQGTRKFSIVVNDFERFLRVQYIRGYNQKDDFKGHVRNLFLRAGVYKGTIEGLIYSLLDLDIQGDYDLPNPDDLNSGVFQFTFQGYFVDALKKLCDDWDFYYDIDYGAWTDIRNLPSLTQPLANLKVVRNGLNLIRAPFDVYIPKDASKMVCGNDGVIQNTLKFRESAHRFSAVIAAGKNSDVDLPFEVLETIDYHITEERVFDIPPSSKLRHYILPENYTVLERISMQ